MSRTASAVGKELGFLVLAAAAFLVGAGGYSLITGEPLAPGLWMSFPGFMLGLFAAAVVEVIRQRRKQPRE